MMLTVITQSVANASFAINFPKFLGTIYELLSAPVSYLEIVLGYVGAAAVKSILIGLVILATAYLFVDLHIAHPVAMLALLALTSVSFSLFGFVIGIWAKDFQQLQLIPLLVLTPLIFLGGSFYSIDMLPGIWRTIALFNPVVYLMSVFRWSFFDTADVPVGRQPAGDPRLYRAVPRRRLVDLPLGLAASAIGQGPLQGAALSASQRLKR